MSKNKSYVESAWFEKPGPDDDVVVSSRVRLARNLANFPFPSNFFSDDSERVQNIIFDSFNHMSNAEAYQIIRLDSIEELGGKILCEKGLIQEKEATAIITRVDGVAACIVNGRDHVRIASFAPGLSCNASYIHAREIDLQMQERIQFAASHEFGYLTASVNDAGSGMKTSLRLHLPSASHAGKIKELIQHANDNGFSMTDCFGSSSSQAATSLGAYYSIASSQSFAGNEIDQLAAITSLGKYISEYERKIRSEYADNKSTAVRDLILRSYATVKSCMLLKWREAVELISTLKWGCDLNLVSGTVPHDFTSLLYRIQSGHLEFLLRTGSFNFEEDVKNSDVLKEERLRAILVQRTFENMHIA